MRPVQSSTKLFRTDEWTNAEISQISVITKILLSSSLQHLKYIIIHDFAAMVPAYNRRGEAIKRNNLKALNLFSFSRLSPCASYDGATQFHCLQTNQMPVDINRCLRSKINPWGELTSSMFNAEFAIFCSLRFGGRFILQRLSMLTHHFFKIQIRVVCKVLLDNAFFVLHNNTFAFV